MPKPNNNLQDQYLNSIRKSKMLVSLYLVNGIKLQGKIESFDLFVIVLSHNGVSQMVYKHAISTVVPAQLITLDRDDTEKTAASE